MCEYFVTKRPGRKRENSRPTNNDSNRESVDAYVTSGSNSYLSPLDLSPTSPRPDNLTGAECSSTNNLSLMPFDSDLQPGLEGMNNVFDDFFTSPINFLDLEALDPTNSTQGPDGMAKFLMPDNNNPGHISETSSHDRQNTSKPSSLSSNDQALSSTNTSVSVVDSTCSCLMQALDLMKKLSSTNSPICVLPDSLDDINTIPGLNPNSNPSAQVIVMENNQAIKAVSTMLQCSCAEDSYLLALLSMIVFKILGRYATAAREQHEEATAGDEKQGGCTSTKFQMQQTGVNIIGSERLGRVAAQLVLSELHHVQRLVNQLSPRLKVHGLGIASQDEGPQDARFFGGDNQVSPPLDKETKTAPFSATTMDQIEIDLRKSLRTLSSEIISILRQS